ncbi:MAG: ABC transporter ATP-binding protein/permease [Chiayiivirga sp.]|jgi:ATP-binding cassette subfamily B protein|uniref:ABC transporter ATP-binding protein n=1 Tax=Chiayiivirga sp. TaxID=2041042 RepID=UPI0025B97694|nr:ABC transporter ATP-binding protein [Chiayiivirga sp.]MCI1710954.1 ABC transporter ATP-binding protein/permease [Chiayiivirga sp.]MCI1728250.1 ABC transporter ATP-binding protein/permease [Chiayiivirga sp.]
MHPLRRLFGYARPYRRDAALATLYSVLNKVFDVLPELLIGVAVDIVVNQRDSFMAGLGVVDPLQQLVWLTAITIVVWLLESLFEYLYAITWRGLAQDLQHELRQAAYGHVQALPPDFVASARSGRLLAVMNEDVHQVERFLNTGANDLVQVMVSSLLVGTVFFVLTWDLAALAFLPIPLILVGAFWFQRRLAPRYAAAREAAATVSSRLNNNLAGMATVQAYTAEDFEAEHVRRASDGYRARNAEAIRYSAAITPVIRLAVLVGFVATLLYGGWKALEGELGVGAYSALVYLTQRLLWPLTRLADMTDLYQRAMASVQRVMDLLETPLPAQPDGKLPVPVRGALRFEGVSVDYDGRRVVHALSLDVPAGETHALVGGTGGGKSSLLKLLLGFVPPAQGRVRVDGVDIATLDPRGLRRHIGYVAQDPFLTDGSIADNIAYGDAAPDPAGIEHAARAAQAHEFIRALPQGYASEVGERGSRLSGGQRQRIALARALYRDPAILVLDEATSAVDNETEAAIQRALHEAARGRTTLVVAHRLSTVRHADAIHVMEAGRIVESGTHEALLGRGCAYAALWRLQAGEGVAAVEA